MIPDKELQITKERLVELRDSHLIKLAHPECELYEKHLTEAIDFIQQYLSIKGVPAEAQISKAQEAFFVSQGRMSNLYDMYNQAKGFNQTRREFKLAIIKEREELNNRLREIANDLGAPVTSWTAECQTGEFEGIIERATKAIHKLLKGGLIKSLCETCKIKCRECLDKDTEVFECDYYKEDK